jgi:SAM-dependent methyltransferase
MPYPRETAEFFDGFAAEYRAGFENNALAAWARQRAQSIYVASFPPNGRLVDIGCGPGIDAVMLASRGHRVTAIDVSQGMVAETRNAANSAGVSRLVTVVRDDAFDPAGGISCGEDRYDGVLLGFGVVNCLPDLSQVYRRCATLLNCGGVMILSALGRHCLWDMMWHLGHRRYPARWGQQPRRAWRGHDSTNMWYWTPRELLASAGPSFSLCATYAVGSVAPPPYANRIFRRFEPSRTVLCRLDEMVSTGRSALAVADMIWCVFRKV